MNTHESYVSLETAKLLKQAGFDWECNHHFCLEIFSENEVPYRNHNSGVDAYGHDNRGQYMSAPTLAIAQKWLREVKGYEVEPYLYVPPEYVNVEPEPWDSYTCDITIPSIRNYGTYDLEDFFKTYEEALEAGIKKCLESILEKDDKD